MNEELFNFNNCEWKPRRENQIQSSVIDADADERTEKPSLVIVYAWCPSARQSAD